MTNSNTRPTDNPRQLYPGLERRYFSTIVDMFAIIAIIILSINILDNLDVLTETARKWAILTPIFLYEAVLTSTFMTLGQYLFRFRVRRHREDDTGTSLKKINIPQAYIRLFLKYFLGAVSCLTMATNPQRRALHDLAIGSVVIGKEQLKELQLAHG